MGICGIHIKNGKIYIIYHQIIANFAINAHKNNHKNFTFSILSFIFPSRFRLWEGCKM